MSFDSSYTSLDDSIVEPSVSTNSKWLRMDEHAFKCPFKNSHPCVVNQRCENFSCGTTLFITTQLRTRSKQIDKIVTEYENILRPKPSLSFKEILGADFYDTDIPTNVNTNVQFEGQGPCDRRRFKHVIACLKDYLA